MNEPKVAMNEPKVAMSGTDTLQVTNPKGGTNNELVPKVVWLTNEILIDGAQFRYKHGSTNASMVLVLRVSGTPTAQVKQLNFTLSQPLDPPMDQSKDRTSMLTPATKLIAGVIFGIIIVVTFMRLTLRRG